MLPGYGFQLTAEELAAIDGLFQGGWSTTFAEAVLGGFSLPEEHDQERDPPREPQDEQHTQQNVADEA
jgi:hypothetical protein